MGLGSSLNFKLQFLFHIGPPTTAPPTTLATTTASTPTMPVVLAPSKPRNVNAAAENTTAIRVFWQEPDQPHGKITKYTVVTYEWAATGY